MFYLATDTRVEYNERVAFLLAPKMMEPIRLTINAARLATIIDLPESLCNQEVDVIVTPTSKQPSSEPKIKSVLGILKQYANSNLQHLENGAWEHAAAEKYLEKEKQ